MTYDFSFWMFPYINYEDSLNIVSLMALYFLSGHKFMSSMGISHILEAFLKIAVTDISIQINSISIFLLSLSTVEVPLSHILYVESC